MKMRIRVLDYGHVELVDHMGNDLTVVNSARVSFNKESSWTMDYPFGESDESPVKTLSQKDRALIKYLAEHKHWTPFSHPQITLRIKAPIFVRTQLFKHKVGFTENEVSRRYVQEDPDIYHPRWRAKPTNGAKQGSEDFIEINDDYNYINRSYSMAVEEAMTVYKTLLEKGVAPEQARSILPQGAYTEWWWTGSLAAYARVYSQRSDPHAQWEVRQYADAFDKIIGPLFPVSWECLTNVKTSGTARENNHNKPVSKVEQQ
jgi:thymidylate synthase (FAD)